MSEDLPSDNAIHFEAVKVALNQTKDGYKLVLAMHPNEVPDEMLRSMVGARYMIAAVEVMHDDQIKPLAKPPADEGDDAVKYAGMLCRDEAFQRYCFKRGWAMAPTAEEAANALRALLRIESRTELKTNEQARTDLYALRDQYLRDSGR